MARKLHYIKILILPNTNKIKLSLDFIGVELI
jgi:hypothetical protein